MNGLVLVVDDNPSDLMLSSSLIESHGFLPLSCSDGFSALEQIATETFSLFIIDLQMPKMTGIELIKRIRRIDKTKQTPVLVTSARQEITDVKLAIASGANDYLVKPIDHQIFEEKTSRLIGKKVDWYEYYVNPEFNNNAVSLQNHYHIRTINEVGATLISVSPITENCKIEISSPLFLSMGLPLVLTQVTDCKKTETLYEIKVNFIGLNEDTSRKIRLLCQKIFKQNKNLK